MTSAFEKELYPKYFIMARMGCQCLLVCAASMQQQGNRTRTVVLQPGSLLSDKLP